MPPFDVMTGSVATLDAGGCCSNPQSCVSLHAEFVTEMRRTQVLHQRLSSDLSLMKCSTCEPEDARADVMCRSARSPETLAGKSLACAPAFEDIMSNIAVDGFRFRGTFLVSTTCSAIVSVHQHTCITTVLDNTHVVIT